MTRLLPRWHLSSLGRVCHSWYPCSMPNQLWDQESVSTSLSLSIKWGQQNDPPWRVAVKITETMACRALSTRTLVLRNYEHQQRAWARTQWAKPPAVSWMDNQEKWRLGQGIWGKNLTEFPPREPRCSVGSGFTAPSVGRKRGERNNKQGNLFFQVLCS